MTMFEKVSPYNYEVLGFVIERLDDAEANGGELVRRASQVLGFLLEYERVAEPGEDEVDFWLESTASQRPFPKAVARRRLPLSWLVTVPPKKKYRILKREFTLDSYKLWSNIAGVMKLQPDNICVFTVQNALSGKDLEHSEDEGEWRSLLREEVLDAARSRGAAAIEEPQDLGVAVQLQVLQGKKRVGVRHV